MSARRWAASRARSRNARGRRAARAREGPRAGAGADVVAGQLAAVAAAGLGPVHRDVGEAQQALRVVAVVVGKRDPHRRGEGHDRRADQHRLREPARMRRATSRASSRPRMLSQRTTNSSPPRRATVSPGRRSASIRRGDRPQHRVAGVVAVGVVDRLEAVEIDEEHGDRPVAAPRAQQGVAKAVEEHGAVGQPGERRRVRQGAGVCS